jgi:hypothetical protein
MKIQNQGNKTTVRNLAIFVVLILASGWLGRGLDVLMGNSSAESLGMLVWIVTPLGLTVVLHTFAGDGWNDFGIKPNFKENWVWYVVAILAFPVLTALVLLIGSGLGFVTFPNLSANTPGLLLQAFALGLLPQFIKNIFEEAPWRGYLAPKVYSLGLNDFVGHAIVGLVWGHGTFRIISSSSTARCSRTSRPWIWPSTSPWQLESWFRGLLYIVRSVS